MRDATYFLKYNSLEERKRTIERLLPQAIVNKELFLVFQPQYDLLTEQLKGAEVLIRWHSRELGNLFPNEFIPVAEQSGLIAPIGEWVLMEALTQNKRWQYQGFTPIRIAVNMSLRQLEDNTFVDIVDQFLKKTKHSPIYLELEITESVMQKSVNALLALKKLKEIGVALSIDDFGTGYSSLRYLKEMPVNSIKIDKGFVSGIENTRDYMIIKSIVELAHQLDLEVIAEGIETKKQINLLKEVHCNEGQGYYFHRPLTVPEFEKYCLEKP